jgi:hypothetical protein
VTNTLSAVMFSNSYVKRRLRYMMLRFVAVPYFCMSAVAAVLHNPGKHHQQLWAEGLPHPILPGGNTKALLARSHRQGRRRQRTNPKKNMVYGILCRSWLYTRTSPYVHSRVDSNTFTMGNPMPESTLTLCQSQLYPPVREFGMDLASVWNQGPKSNQS